MIVSRRKRADQFSSAALAFLAAGLVGAAWLALKPPAPAVRSRAPAAPQFASAAGPAAPAADDLSVLWPDVRDPDAGSSHGVPPSTAESAASASAAQAPSFAVLGMIGALSGTSSLVFVQLPAGVSLIHQGEVVDGWKLIGVKGSVATFARQDRQVTLSLAKRTYDAGSSPSPSSPAPAASGRSPRPAIGNPAELAQNSRSVAVAPASVNPPAPINGADKAVAVPRTLVDMARTDPLAAMKGMGMQVQPYMSNGQMQGFEIGQIAADSPAAQYFTSGDRILAVNGNPITSVSQAWAAYQQLHGASSVTITIERGGKQQNVVYSAQ